MEDAREVFKKLTEVKGGLEEAGFSRLMQAFRGDVPNVDTIGILTASNPQGKPYPEEENQRRNKGLRSTLASGGYGFRAIKGLYGVPEDSFVVNNISKEFTIALGKRYDQDTVIFGKKTKTGFHFEMIKCATAKVEDQQDVVLSGDDTWEDFYSKVKNRKFKIPFYDPAYAGAKWGTDERGRVDVPPTRESSQVLVSRPDLRGLLKSIQEAEQKLSKDVSEGKVGSYMVSSRARLRGLVWQLEDALEA